MKGLNRVQSAWLNPTVPLTREENVGSSSDSNLQQPIEAAAAAAGAGNACVTHLCDPLIKSVTWLDMCDLGSDRPRIHHAGQTPFYALSTPLGGGVAVSTTPLLSPH